LLLVNPLTLDIGQVASLVRPENEGGKRHSDRLVIIASHGFAGNVGWQAIGPEERDSGKRTMGVP